MSCSHCFSIKNYDFPIDLHMKRSFFSQLTSHEQRDGGNSGPLRAQLLHSPSCLSSSCLRPVVYICVYILYIYTIYIYVCIMYQINLMTCICVAMILYNYIYIQRERERVILYHLDTYQYIYIYIYIISYIYIILYYRLIIHIYIIYDIYFDIFPVLLPPFCIRQAADLWVSLEGQLPQRRRPYQGIGEHLIVYL